MTQISDRIPAAVDRGRDRSRCHCGEGVGSDSGQVAPCQEPRCPRSHSVAAKGITNYDEALYRLTGLSSFGLGSAEDFQRLNPHEITTRQVKQAGLPSILCL